MCTVPPPPPVPSLSPIKKIQPNASTNETIDFPEVCEWAAFEPQLWEVCAKNQICLNQSPFRYKYRHFESILQNGPTCGLVALSMFVRSGVTPDELLNITKIEGYSNNGEMLSCNDMAKLADKALCLAEIENVSCTLKQSGLYSHKTIHDLLNGAILLVPYDADFNHSPCQRHGHTAHWALVCGIIIVEDPGECYDSNPSNVYVVCRHGKSRFLAAWTLDELHRSNINLWEFSPKKAEDALIYVLPEGGIGGEKGLRNQFLMFYSS